MRKLRRSLAEKTTADPRSDGPVDVGAAPLPSSDDGRPAGTATDAPTEAQSWDVHRLYEYSVQSPQADAEFLATAFGDRYRRSPVLVREDFCGTAAMAREWVRLSPGNRACGVDIDAATLEYGRRRNAAVLSAEQQQRITLVRANVLQRRPDDERVDVVAAHNFSWMLFHDRRKLREYFKACRDSLNDEGCLVLDIYGGPDAQTVCHEMTEHKDVGFTYHWEQASFDAVTNIARCNIHFSFPDGSTIPNAFSYRWRLWSLPELRDVLMGAHFHKVQVYWEVEDQLEYDGNYGDFAPVRSADNDSSWIAYVVAYKS